MPLASASNTGPSNPNPSYWETALRQEQPSLLDEMCSTAAKNMFKKTVSITAANSTHDYLPITSENKCKWENAEREDINASSGMSLKRYISFKHNTCLLSTCVRTDKPNVHLQDGTTHKTMKHVAQNTKNICSVAQHTKTVSGWVFSIIFNRTSTHNNKDKTASFCISPTSCFTSHQFHSTL
jgi:hypothetical protein